METHEPDELASVVAESQGLQKPKNASDSIPAVTADEDSVTVRAIREVVIRDEQLKREIVEAVNGGRGIDFQQ